MAQLALGLATAEYAALYAGADASLAFSVFAGPAISASLTEARETVQRFGGLDGAKAFLALRRADAATALRFQSHRFADRPFAPEEWRWEGGATIAPREPVHERPPAMIMASYGKSGAGRENYERTQTGILFYHEVVEPSEEQVDAWITAFEYKDDHTGQLYPELLSARNQLIGQLGLRGQTDAESLANLRELSRSVLIQIAQFLRQPTGKNVPGYNLPLIPQRQGLLVTSDENATRLISRFIAPNDLAIAAAGTGRITPYRIKARLLQSVAEILRAGHLLIDALRRARGGAGVKPSVTELVGAIHGFRETVSRAHDASVPARYSPTPEEKLQVAYFAADLLNVESPKGISADQRLGLQGFFVAQERAYVAASEKNPIVQVPGTLSPNAESAAPVVVETVQIKMMPSPAAAAKTGPVDEPVPQEITVREIAAQYYGGSVTGRFGTTLEGTPPPLLYVDGQPYRGSEATRYWERAVRFYTNPRFGQGELTEIWWQLEMADAAGRPIPLPPELLPYYKPRRR